jgi:hypothetical protein
MMRAERLRLLLGVMILAVGVRFALVLVVPPDDTYTVQHQIGTHRR